MYGIANRAMCSRFSIFSLLVSSVFLLLGPSVLGGEKTFAKDTVENYNAKTHNFSMFVSAYGFFVGGYDNLTDQRSDSASPLEIHSAAGLYGELGFRFDSFGVSYCLEAVWSPSTTYQDDQGFSHGAGRERHVIRVSYQILHRTFHLIPEGGCVFLNEDAGIKDPDKKKPDRYYEKHKDEGYNYGLSARIKLIPIRKVGLWLYGRYVYDDLDTKADNYWIEIHAGGINPEPPWVDKDRPYVESGYLILGIRWTKKTDGRSEWFLTLGVSGSLGLF